MALVLLGLLVFPMDSVFMAHGASAASGSVGLHATAGPLPGSPIGGLPSTTSADPAPGLGTNVAAPAWGGFGTTDGLFNVPWGVAADAAGNVYVADSGNHRIQVFDREGRLKAVWGIRGSAQGQLYWPSGIAVDAAGLVYVVDRGNNRIQVFDGEGRLQRAWGTLGQAAGQFAAPWGVALDALGQVYVTDGGNHRVQIFDRDGKFLRAFGGEGSTAGQFAWPSGVAVTAAGLTYVADWGNDRIQVFDHNGRFLRQWAGDGTPEGGLDFPEGVAVDGAGRVYIADWGNHRIQVFDDEGASLRIRGSINGALVEPRGVAIDDMGQVFVSDASTHQIYAFVPLLPALQSPADGSRLEAMGTTLQWALPPEATQYHLQVTPPNGDGPGIEVIRNAESGYPIPAPQLGGGNYVLLPDMTYSWRLRLTSKPAFAPVDDPSWGPWSPLWTFRTPVRLSVGISPVAPPDGSAAATTAPLSLQWRDLSSDTFYYEVQTSIDPLFGDAGISVASVWHNLVHGGVTTPSNSWTTPPLEPGRRYYWRVRPRVQGDGSPVTWSRTWSFTTP